MATETLVVFAILAALGLICIAVVEAVFIIPQEADALGRNRSIAVNASNGRCFRG